jgi:hypothetical protein
MQPLDGVCQRSVGRSSAGHVAKRCAGRQKGNNELTRPEQPRQPAEVYFEEQVDEIIRTESTSRRCALDIELDIEPEPVAVPPAVVPPAVVLPVAVPPAVVPPVVPDVLLELLDTSLPLISTSWFTCFDRSLDLPSSMYVVPLDDIDELEPLPVVPAVALPVVPAVVPPAVVPPVVVPDAEPDADEPEPMCALVNM